MTEAKDIVILTATYNDWDAFLPFLESLDESLSQASLNARVVVVDDGSSFPANNPVPISQGFSAIHQVTAITLARNMGNQRAIAIGLGYIAKEMDCDYLVIMDSDMEDLPEYVPQLVERASETNNKIIFAERTSRANGITFKLFYGLYKSLYRMLTGMPISIGNFSAIPGRLVKRIAAISEIWSHFPAGIMRAKVPYETLPSSRGSRLHGESKMNLVSLVIHGISGLSVHADVVGVRLLLGILGLSAIILTSITVIVLQKLFTDIHMLGWTSQIVLVLGSILFQMLIAAMLIVFLVLAQKNQRTIIPAIDYDAFIFTIEQLYPATSGTPAP
ncbi:MAG: glycosyltransferase [Rhodospirillales bacterium]|nr:glycosyltransferase [Rhodospirillales bacterium]